MSKLDRRHNIHNASGPSGPTARVQVKLDETGHIMRKNVNDVIGRGERLDAIQSKSDDLERHANAFKKSTRRKTCCGRLGKSRLLWSGCWC